MGRLPHLPAYLGMWGGLPIFATIYYHYIYIDICMYIYIYIYSLYLSHSSTSNILALCWGNLVKLVLHHVAAGHEVGARGRGPELGASEENNKNNTKKQRLM